jgi:hypothetical protein
MRQYHLSILTIQQTYKIWIKAFDFKFYEQIDFDIIE